MEWKTCMSGAHPDYEKEAREMHKDFYGTEVCEENDHECGGKLVFDYGAEGHFCTGCGYYDGWK